MNKNKNGYKENRMNRTLVVALVIALLVVTGLFGNVLELVIGVIGGFIGLTVGLIAGAVGLVVGLIGGMIGLVFGLLPLIIVIALVSILVKAVNGNSPKRKKEEVTIL